MEKNKILLIGCTAVLLAFGLVMAVNAMNGMGRQPRDFPPRGAFMPGGCGEYGNKTSFQDELGLPENATFKQISDARWEKELKELGLTEDSTLREYRQAIEAKRQAMEENMKTWMEARMQNLREKLNLPENATQEEIQKALQEWRVENTEMTFCGSPNGCLSPGFKVMGRREF